MTKNDKVIIALTIAIALGTIVSAGAITMQWREMVGGGKQTEQIIAAAEKTKEAAEKSAQASRDFADAADDINGSMNDAVAKLNTQASETQRLVATAQNIYEAADRAYIGMSGGTIQYYDRNNNPVPNNARRTGGAVLMVFSPGFKNYGTVPGEKIVSNGEVIIDGVLINSSSIPSKPATLFPGQTLYKQAIIGGPSFDLIMQGKSVLQYQIGITYNSHGKTYTYCDRQQYAEEQGDFMDLGEECDRPWAKSPRAN